MPFIMPQRHNECLRGTNKHLRGDVPRRRECLLVSDLSISRLARDALGGVCDITLRNVLAFDVCLKTGI